MAVSGLSHGYLLLLSAIIAGQFVIEVVFFA